MTRSKNLSWLSCFLALPLLAGLGCGGSGGTVTGKVTYKGQPVKGGSLTFTPDQADVKNPGKPGSASVNDQGQYETTDQVPLGKAKIQFTPPIVEWDATKARPGDQPPKSPYANLVTNPQTVEIKSGKNTLDIELVPAGTVR